MSAPSDLRSDALKRLLVPLIKLALVGEGELVEAWRAAALEAQRGIATADLPPERFDAVWAASVKAAEGDPAVRRDETVNPMLPTMPPITLGQLAAAPFDLDAAVLAIRDAASFG